MRTKVHNERISFLTPRLSVGLFKALSNKGFSPIYLPPLIKTQMVLKNKFIVFRGALRLMEVV
ncbi:MAG: hypothetical protein KKH32_00950, partial [Bacteroidetes bacterium]|nr:hypothetical protein [Bacteroidota bacterium]